MNGNSSLNLIGGLAIGLCLGAGLMYYLDPKQGRRRRALVRDRAVYLAHETEDLATAKARHMGDRARGIVAQTRQVVELTGFDPDAICLERQAEAKPHAPATY
jgi:hypothetical protein